jgi:ADP-heptose:LPS heptosyltransferase
MRSDSVALAQVLVIHPGALGDLLLAVPALRALRRTCDRHAIALAAQPRIGSLLEALGVVDAAIAFDSLELDALFIADATRPVDARLLAAAHVVSWFGARDATYRERLSSLVERAMIAPSIPAAGTAVWEQLVRTVAGDVREPSLREPMAVPSDLVAAGRAMLLDAGWDGRTPLVFVHAGASGPRKRWPAAGFARLLNEVCRGHRVRAVLHQGPTDGGVVAALRGHLAVDVLELHSPALPELAGLLHHVALHVGNDSGISHLAAALGVPAVILFAQENAAWRPWSTSAHCIAVDALAGDEDVARVLDAVEKGLGCRDDS